MNRLARAAALLFGVVLLASCGARSTTTTPAGHTGHAAKATVAAAPAAGR
ncbi:hypothetical protein AB0K16_47165 [Nonomuraea jabiensis]